MAKQSDSITLVKLLCVYFFVFSIVSTALSVLFGYVWIELKGVINGSEYGWVALFPGIMVFPVFAMCSLSSLILSALQIGLAIGIILRNPTIEKRRVYNVFTVINAIDIVFIIVFFIMVVGVK